MASGGRRQGAGRPTGGISEATRIINEAIERGFVQVGKSAGIEGDDREIVIQSVAQVAANMITAGRGDEVLKIWVVNAGKEGAAGGSGGSKSPVMEALESLPGDTPVLDSSSAPVVADSGAIESGACEQGAADNKSAGLDNPAAFGPFQPNLLPQLAATPPPPPPLEGPTPLHGVEPEIFEKSEVAA